jgi:hypothetical protein
MYLSEYLALNCSLCPGRSLVTHLEGARAQRRKKMTSSPLPQSTPPDPGNRDNDRLWIAGGFYVNRYDPRLLVEKRSGLGWTFNFAHPIAWWLTGGLFVILGLVQLYFFITFHSYINLVLLGLFLALCLLLFVGYLRVRASEQA